MKNMDQNPWVWFLLILLGGWALDFETFVVIAFAIIVAKQVEMMNK